MSRACIAQPFAIAALAATIAVAIPAPAFCSGENVITSVQCRVIDLVPEFWDFWAHAKDQPPNVQLQLFDQMLRKRHPGVYTEGVLSIGSASPHLNRQVLEFLKTIGPAIPKMDALSRHLRADVPRYVRDFQKSFPDFRCDAPVYFLISFGAFDGATRFINGRQALLFGVDVIAEVHDANDLGAFFDHELFHVYHRQIVPEVDVGMGGPLYLALWEEGLATYVSQVLNPQVSESRILGQPKDLAQRANPLLGRIAAEMIRDMDDTSRSQYRTFFLGKSGREDVPPRSGYYLGLLVAREVNKTLSLRQMVALKGEPLRATIRKTLQEFAAPNAKSPVN